ncbi:murein hydrolase activator EnvC [Acuticoccus sp. I52.16.1]|uniref:murein hydrolase activator EnvC family protein n=1 Tax=Acuticoccus sp. I52.16.1 TaxID=2928472 RepID=UPI001FD1C13F|nr:peptidoglycan DD-metalloendopeptidase family protein [Acuticoccus sp. I52.16.1]UOM36935.1 peptidoglycan DD-metalloendopeptidase family protein [Acuticoccus sp. I52.16.1]
MLPLAATAQETPSAAGDGGADRERQQLVQRLERLRESASAAEARATELSDELVDLAGDEAKLRERTEETAAKVAGLEQQISAEEDKLERLTDDQAAIRQDLAAKRSELSSVLMALQRIGRRPPPALFGDTGDPTDTVRGAILLNAVLPELDKNARTLTATLTRAARLEADERASWAKLREDLEELNGERRRLDELSAELQRRRALSLYERERASADAARLAEEERTVAGLIERLQREGTVTAAPPAQPFEQRRGSLTLPVAGRVISTFGETTGTGDVSNGRTIAALPQATVFAPMAATVLFSAPFSDYGEVLILDAGQGYHMVLAGLESTSVVIGDRVEPGAPLGRMGESTRRSAAVSASVKGSDLLGSRPALYIELRKDRIAIDSQGWWREATADAGRTSG